MYKQSAKHVKYIDSDMFGVWWDTGPISQKIDPQVTDSYDRMETTEMNSSYVALSHTSLNIGQLIPQVTDTSSKIVTPVAPS